MTEEVTFSAGNAAAEALRVFSDLDFSGLQTFGVLAAFIGILIIGYSFPGRKDRRKYGLLVLGIGVFFCAFPEVFTAVTSG